MTAINSILQFNTTLSLRSGENGDNLIYLVEIETGSKTYNCFSSENYAQALLVAKKIFNKLKIKQEEIGNFAVSIETQQGRGVCFDINNFSFDPSFQDTLSFYKNLACEFEHIKFIKKVSSNVAFREVTNDNKLNEYQEQRFLMHLKKFKDDK